MKNIQLLRAIGVVGLMAIVAACQGVDAGSKDTGEGLDEGASIGDAAITDLEVAQVDEAGVPKFAKGTFGRVDISPDAKSVEEQEAQLRPTLEKLGPIFRASADELTLQSTFTDNLGDRHFVYGQRKNGLEVLGGALVLQTRAGQVYAVHGSARTDLAAPLDAQIDAEEAVLAAKRDSARLGDLEVEAIPRLAYRLAEDRLELVYRVKVTGVRRDGTPVNDDVLISATDGSVVQRIPHIYTARNREVHNLNHGTGLPGPVSRTETSAPANEKTVDDNFAKLGQVYDAYKALFNRDSFDNAGAKLISSVHYSNNYVNAFWNGTQMVYGDGDNVTASNLAESLDVTGHELTHAVTERTSNLTYSGQSGGLNESMSDIFGNVIEWYRDVNGDTSQPPNANNFLVGDDVWTPATPGDALRYMCDPKKDGSSLDYAPDFTSGIDVHYSSGVQNLAFCLLVKGGTHPRGKTTVNVTGIGMLKAAQVFYRANTVKLVGHPNATFADAKTATEQAASELGLSAAEIASVTAAWQAVGVGGVVTPPPTCHDTCTTGAALTASCSSCVSNICAVDPYCCSTLWDSICVSEVESVCGSLKCDASKGSCSHTLCSTGAALVNGCAPATTSICGADSYCCATSWDSICVNEVSSIAGKNCN